MLEILNTYALPVILVVATMASLKTLLALRGLGATMNKAMAQIEKDEKAYADGLEQLVAQKAQMDEYLRNMLAASEELDVNTEKKTYH